MKQYIIVCALIKHGDKYLFIRQNKAVGAYPNTLHIPGGKLEAGEDPMNAIEREIKEETNITVENILPFDFDSDITEYKGEQVQFIFLRFVADYKEGEPRPGSDASEILWIGKKDLCNYNHNAPSKRLLKKLGLI